MCENKVEENKIRKDSVIYDIDHFFYIAYVHNKGILFFLNWLKEVKSALSHLYVINAY